MMTRFNVAARRSCVLSTAIVSWLAVSSATAQSSTLGVDRPGGYAPATAWGAYAPTTAWGGYSSVTVPPGTAWDGTTVVAVTPRYGVVDPNGAWLGYNPTAAWVGYDPGRAWVGFAPGARPVDSFRAGRGGTVLPPIYSYRELGTGRNVPTFKPWLPGGAP